MTALEIRLALYALLLVGIGGWLLYERHHLIDEGEQRILASDKAAVAKQAQAVAKQKAADKVTSDETVAGLQAELASLRDRAAAGSAATRGVRCYAQRPGAVPPTPAASGSSQPADAGAGNLAAVPSGASVGPDIGPGMQLVADAGAVAAAYQRACASFALKVSAPAQP